MAFRLRVKASAVAEIRRVLLEQNDQALALLRGWRGAPADRVHQARRCFKRSRAALRLLKPAAPYVFAVENRTCRDLAKRLSGTRDAAAMVEVVDRLAQRQREPAAALSLRMLRDSLQQRAERETEDRLSGIDTTIAEVCAELELRHERLSQLPVAGLRWRDLNRGARHNWKRCRRGYEAARDSGDDEAFHDWRKYVKYAYYHTALLRRLRPKWSARNRETLDQLGEVLGHFQDLTVLEQLLDAQPDDLGIDLHLQRLRRLLRFSQSNSRTQALALGRQLFEDKQDAAPPVVEFPRLQQQSAGG
ncbi:MAG: CHAD domain-containing protein [Gammaproteobacteria bacterium]|nr:CHAD domain-containing protein [Gammaproteobacteria bacterium]